MLVNGKLVSVDANGKHENKKEAKDKKEVKKRRSKNEIKNDEVQTIFAAKTVKGKDTKGMSSAGQSSSENSNKSNKDNSMLMNLRNGIPKQKAKMDILSIKLPEELKHLDFNHIENYCEKDLYSYAMALETVLNLKNSKPVH